jgi:hypothetical protein
MIPSVPCPAHGSYKDRAGVRRYYRSASPCQCLQQPYDACSRCPNSEFELTLVKADTPVECPVLEAAANGGGHTSDPVRNADINRLRDAGGVTDPLITLNTCASRMPFQVCAGCPTRNKWTTKPRS